MSHFAWENMVPTSQSATAETFLELPLPPLLLGPAAEMEKRWIREQERVFKIMMAIMYAFPVGDSGNYS